MRVLTARVRGWLEWVEIFFGKAKLSGGLPAISLKVRRVLPALCFSFIISGLPSTSYSFLAVSACYSSYELGLSGLRDKSGLFESCTGWYLSVDEACAAFKPIFLRYVNISAPFLNIISVETSGKYYDHCYVEFTRIAGPGEAVPAGTPVHGNGVNGVNNFADTSTLPELKNPGLCTPGAAYSGNPINTGTGNKVQCEADVQTPGFQRCYNHKQNDQLGFKVSFGARWTHSYTQKIISQTTGALLFLRPNGQQLYFSQQAGGSWQGEPDNADHLERLTNAQGNFLGWRYTVAATDEVELYDATGKLLSITARNRL